MILHQLFCDADDFCIDFLPLWHSTLLGNGDKKRLRNKYLSESEIITIVFYFQLSGFRVFKWFYQRHVAVYKKAEFPNLPSLSIPLNTAQKTIIKTSLSLCSLFLFFRIGSTFSEK